MKIIFLYDPSREYDNFRRSFYSINHPKASPRQNKFFRQFNELTEDNALVFCKQYITENNISIADRLLEIEKKWRQVENEYFKRAEQVFKKSLPKKTISVYLTIHDRCSYNFDRNEFFIHLNLPATNKTIMHELWHWYFYYTVGQKIKNAHGQKVFNDIKEALTVLLNVIYADVLDGVTDKGYPQHTELRELIRQTYTETNDVYQTIDKALKTITGV